MLETSYIIQPGFKWNHSESTAFYTDLNFQVEKRCDALSRLHYRLACSYETLILSSLQTSDNNFELLYFNRLPRETNSSALTV